jgi:hypothetical protein
LEIRLQGAVNFQTTSNYGPVQIFSRGLTQFRSVKPIGFDGQQIHLQPARTTAETHLEVTGIDTSLRLGRRLALRIAPRRVENNRPQAEAITTNHTARRINRELDAAIDADVAALAKTMIEQLKALDGEGQLAATRVRCSTTKDFLQVVLLGTGDALPIKPPAAQPGRPDVEIYVHSSLVLKTLTDASFRQMLQGMKDRVMRIAGARLALQPVSSSSTTKELPFSVSWSPGGSWLTVVWNADGRKNSTVEELPLPKRNRTEAARVVQGN